jgi:predicted small metal-binding protein
VDQQNNIFHVERQGIHHILSSHELDKMAEVDVEKFYERLNKVHAHFVKNR